MSKRSEQTSQRASCEFQVAARGACQGEAELGFRRRSSSTWGPGAQALFDEATKFKFACFETRCIRKNWPDNQ